MMKRVAVLSLCLILACPGIVLAELSWKDLGLPATRFPQTTQYYQVHTVDEDPSAPGFLIFSVSSEKVKTRVEGLADLKKWSHEAVVVVELDKDKNAVGGIADGAVESVKGTGRGLKNLVLHPVNSVKGIGTAAGRVGTKVGDAFREKEEGEKGDSFLSSGKRQIAKKLGVDVYSRNEVLQEKLSTLAKQEMGGRGIVMVAKFFIPVGLVASAVMTASNINNAADGLVNDRDRADLYSLNKKALIECGFEPGKAVAFLNHGYYTPREITYFRFYFEKLSRLRGYKALLDEATRLSDAVPARKFLHEVQIAADAADTMPDAVAVDIVPEGLLIERKNAAVLICGYDYLDASPLGDRIIKKADEYKWKLKKSSAEIWNAGIVTPRFGASLLVTGIKARRMCLFRDNNNNATVDGPAI